MIVYAAAHTQLLLLWSAVFLGLVTVQVLLGLGHINRSMIAKSAPVGICLVLAAFAGLIL